MTTSEWSALRVGDHVLVHDVAGADSGAVLGASVAVVDASVDPHMVGIRVNGAEVGSAVDFPSRLRLHADPFRAKASCMWCSGTG